jgi:hypothetical protein
VRVRPPTGILLAASVLLAAAAGGDATTLRPLPFREIARRADRIVVATVAGSSCRLGAAPGGHVRPYTDVVLEDLSEVAGSVPTRNLVLSVVGGTVEGRTTRVPGTPVLEEGRRYVLFLKDSEPFCGLVGWTQGVFRVVPGPDGVVRVHTHDGEPVGSLAGGRVAAGGEALPLAEFLGTVWALRSPAPPAPPAAEDR